MNAFRTLIPALALGALLTGCNAGLDAQDIAYRELRIDLFSHDWETRRLNAADVEDDGRVLFGEDGGEMTLRSKALLKPLPEHVVRTMDGDKLIFYVMDPEPKSFTCISKTRGWFQFPEEEPDDRSALFYTYENAGSEQVYYAVAELHESERWSPANDCGTYYPGKGLLVYPNGDIGELIVRY